MKDDVLYRAIGDCTPGDTVTHPDDDIAAVLDATNVPLCPEDGHHIDPVESAIPS